MTLEKLYLRQIGLFEVGKFAKKPYFSKFYRRSKRAAPSGIRGSVACATEGCCDRKKKELKCVQFYGSTTYLYNDRQDRVQKIISDEDLEWPDAILLRTGKKNYHLVIIK